MHTLGHLALSWIVKSIIVMLSVSAVSPKSPENTLPRALVVSLLVAVLVHPFTGMIGILLIVPALLALVLWTFIYALAYGIGPFRSFTAGLVQAALGFLLELLLGRAF